MTALEFIQQARWLAEQRRYKQSWAYIVFKQRYGIWPNSLRKVGDPKPATQEFMDWLEVHWEPTRQAWADARDKEAAGTGLSPKKRINTSTEQ